MVWGIERKSYSEIRNQVSAESLEDLERQNRYADDTKTAGQRNSRDPASGIARPAVPMIPHK
jgi:hypothetical protein